MTDDRPYIELEFTGDTLTQSNSNTLNGTDIVIDYGDGTIINYTGDYSHTYSSSGTYTIRIYGVTSLRRSCFRGCSGFISVIIPDSITSLGLYCFDSCSGLTNIVIPNSITSLEFGCFDSCSGLTSMVISESVTSLGDYCFYKCSGLTSVSIPYTVTSLGDYCFSYCSGLADIQFNWTSSNDILTYNSRWIANTDSSLVFLIPQGTTSLYEAKGYPTAKLEEASPHLFTDVKRLFLNNKEVKSIVIDEPDGGVIYKKATLILTVLTIEVPALVYSDVFDITGILTDENGDGIGGANVKLIRDGNILEATETTDLNGEVTFHRSAPTSITTYTFQLVFDGDSDYNNSSSSVVTRNVNAETTILNLTSPLNNATYNEGEIIPISGTITTDDGEEINIGLPMIVKVYDENNNLLQRFMIRNGAFSGNITAPSSAGNHSITVKFEGASTALLPPEYEEPQEPPSVPSAPDEERPSIPSTPDEKPQVPSAPDEEPQEPQLVYAPSEATRSYTVTSDSLTVTSNKNILSQADNDAATLTATLFANDNVGKEVVFSTDVLKSTVVSESGTYDFENKFVFDCSILSAINEEELWINKNGMYIHIYPQNTGKIGITVMNSSNSVKQLGGTDGTFTIENGFIKGHGLDDDFSWDISNVDLTDWTLSSGISVTVDEYFYRIATTDSSGVAIAPYISRGAGDVTITATYKSKQATCNISDYPAIYIDNCDGTQKEIFTTTAEGETYKTFSYTTYGKYPCLNHNTNFGWYPSSSSGNMLIEFDMYPRGSWEGTSIKGANGTRLVWYMQGSQYNDMSYQIAVKVPSQWNKCKILIQDGVVTAWLNDNQIGQITTTVTHPLYDEMGSGTNPCYIKNLKIIELP